MGCRIGNAFVRGVGWSGVAWCAAVEGWATQQDAKKGGVSKITRDKLYEILTTRSC